MAGDLAARARSREPWPSDGGRTFVVTDRRANRRQATQITWTGVARSEARDPQPRPRASFGATRDGRRPWPTPNLGRRPCRGGVGSPSKGARIALSVAQQESLLYNARRGPRGTLAR